MSKNIIKTKIPIISNIIASLSAVIGISCCILPTALINLGLGAAWLSSFAVLQPFRSYFIAVSILAILIGDYTHWASRKPECGLCEDLPKQETTMRIQIIIFALIIGIVIIWPHIRPALIRAFQ